MTPLGRLWNDRTGGTAAEFALVLPLLILLIFGIIDGGRYLWEVNQAKKATQMGVRFAVVTDPVEAGFMSQSFVGKTVTVGGAVRTLTQGDVIPREALGTILCDEDGCTPGSPALDTPSFDRDAFTAIVDRMQLFDPRIDDANVEVEYSGSGLGFAGDPNGPDLAPLVTVSLTGMTFTPIFSLQLFDVPIPRASSSLSAEDFAGTTSN